MYSLIDSLVVEGHTVTLKVTYDNEVLLFVDGSVGTIDEDPKVKLRLALAAKRLWKKTLKYLQPGVYKCQPTSLSRWKVYVSAGWRPMPLGRGAIGGLIYFHKVPPIPTGGLTRGYRN
jgi:hypothetical protein